MQKERQPIAARRLLTPGDNSANLYFQAVLLGREPVNYPVNYLIINYQVTLGLASIVDTDTQRAVDAVRQAAYKKAE